MNPVDIQEFLDEFFEEFQYRVNSIASESNDLIRKDMLYLLVENLILKYENKIQGKQDKSLFQKIFPFFTSTNSYDKEFERQINEALEELTKSNGNHNLKDYTIVSEQFSSKMSDEFHSMQDKQRNLPSKISIQEKQRLAYEKLIKGHKLLKGYSKTNLPNYVDIAVELDLLPDKQQDHADYFVLSSGSVGIIIADGVSGDGKLSANLAQSLPTYVAEVMEEEFHGNLDLMSWRNIIVDALDYAIENYELKGGASTFLIAIVEPQHNQLYTAWLGDGNMIYFNENHTGFSKLLTPHQDNSGKLTRAVTSEGLLGQPSVQILSAPGGSIILSSDGWHLNNGGILRHFFQKVLKSTDLTSGLKTWTKFCCENTKFHPPASDDRSIAVIRWKEKEIDEIQDLEEQNL